MCYCEHTETNKIILKNNSNLRINSSLTRFYIQAIHNQKQIHQFFADVKVDLWMMMVTVWATVEATVEATDTGFHWDHF